MITARDRGLGHALRIQRTLAEEGWKDAIEAITDPEEQRIAREYLRAMYQRRRVAEATKAARAAKAREARSSVDGQG